MASIKKPEIDPEMVPALSVLPGGDGLSTHEGILATRKMMDAGALAAMNSIDDEIAKDEITFQGPDGNTIELLVMRLKKSTGEKRPCIYNIHGGGMVLGSRYMFIGSMVPYIKEFDVVLVSVEYRLAPETKAPAQVEDSYAGLKHVADHASDLGIDAEKIMVYGGSAGGGLAAGVALLARDRKGPALMAQLLIYPMIDDRNETLSVKQFWDLGTYTGAKNLDAWNAMLPNRGQEGVSQYVAPARAADLSGLPRTFIEVGSAEPFRDENVAYAMKLWEHGVDAELHVWPGGLHGYDFFAANSKVSKAAAAARVTWLRRVFA